MFRRLRSRCMRAPRDSIESGNSFHKMKVRSYYVQVLAALLVVATILLMWFGYRATSEWQRSTQLVADRRTVEVLYLMGTALSLDMRAVHSQVLPQLSPVDSRAEPYESGDEFAKGFARVP